LPPAEYRIKGTFASVQRREIETHPIAVGQKNPPRIPAFARGCGGHSRPLPVCFGNFTLGG
jgi:hypothetical protein